MELDNAEPPEFGEINLSFHLEPVSVQAARETRRKLCESVRVKTRPLEYVLDGYVFIDIEWHIHERFRWESDASADVDNIVKPLLDSLCGPEGILVDDSQVKSFSSSWFSQTTGQQRVDIRIRFTSEEFLPKKNLCFVRVDRALFYPVPGEVRAKPAVLRLWLLALKASLATRSVLQSLTNSYYPARYVLPRSFFHRTRLNGWRTCEESEL